MQIGPQGSQSKCRETIKKDTEVVQIGSNNTLHTYGGEEEENSDPHPRLIWQCLETLLVVRTRGVLLESSR